MAKHTNADAFPALTIRGHAAHRSDRVQRYVQSLQRYLKHRSPAVEAAGGLDRYLELLQLRAQVGPDEQALASETYGADLSQPEDVLNWPVGLRRGDEGQTIANSEARILTTGDDGLVIAIDFKPRTKQRLIIDLQVHDGINAQLMVESRWTRQVTPGRWHAGVLIEQMRIRHRQN